MAVQSNPAGEINLRQFGWTLLAAPTLLVLWELGKFVARRSRASGEGCP